MAATVNRKKRSATKTNPNKCAEEWMAREEDPPGFAVKMFENKGRGVITTVVREKGEFLLVYNGEVVGAEEGECREEEDGGSGYRYFFKAKGKNLCVDATKETGSLGRLVNHGNKKERNAVMRTVEDKLCLFSLRDIDVGEEILYDYGIKDLPWEKPLQSHQDKKGKMEAPELTKKLTDRICTEGRPIKLECAVTGIPNPDVKWFINDQPIKPDQNLHTDSRKGFSGDITHSLNIDSIEIDCAGRVKAVATNKAGQVETVANLTVEEKKETPKFVRELENIDTIEKKAVTFEAEVTGKPIPHVTWSRGNIELMGDTDDIKIDFRDCKNMLTLVNVKPTEAAPYSPKAHNSANQTACSARVKVTPVEEAPDTETVKPVEDLDNTESVLVDDSERIPGKEDEFSRKMIPKESEKFETTPDTKLKLMEEKMIIKDKKLEADKHVKEGKEYDLNVSVGTKEITRKEEALAIMDFDIDITTETLAENVEVKSEKFDINVDVSVDTEEKPDVEEIQVELETQDLAKKTSSIADEFTVELEEESFELGRKKVPTIDEKHPTETKVDVEKPICAEKQTPVSQDVTVDLEEMVMMSDLDILKEVAVGITVTEEEPVTTVKETDVELVEQVQNSDVVSDEVTVGLDEACEEKTEEFDVDVSNIIYYAKACFHTETNISDDLIEANNNDEVILTDKASFTNITNTCSEINISDESDLTSEANVEYEVDITNAGTISVVTCCTDSAYPCVKADFNDDHVTPIEVELNDLMNMDCAAESDTAYNSEVSASIYAPVMSSSAKEASSPIRVNFTYNDSDRGIDTITNKVEVPVQAYNVADVTKVAVQSHNTVVSHKTEVPVPEVPVQSHRPIRRVTNKVKINEEGNILDRTLNIQHSLKDKCWGTVAVVKGGVEREAFPMYSTVLAIGSARSNDIIIKNAAAHEVLLEVNRFNEIFLVDARTCEVKRLQDNDLFEVGGRALKWKLNKDSRDGETQDTKQPNEHEAPCTEHTVDIVPDSESDGSVVYPIEVCVMKADTTTAAEGEGLEDVQQDQVMTVNKKTDRKGKNDYSKLHACIYCGKLDLKISRHLCRKHKNEKEIAQLPAPSKTKTENQLDREYALDALRNDGDFLYNIEVLKNKNDKRELIVSRRPEKGVHVKADYLPCKYCLRFYVKDELWRHGRRCNFSPHPLPSEHVTAGEEEKVQRKMVEAGMRLLHGAGVRAVKENSAEKEEFYVYVLQALQDDSIGKGIKNDPGIMMFGRTEFDRLGRRRAGEVRYRMRLLERIKRAARSLGKNYGSELSSYLAPDKFDAIVSAVRTTVGVSDERSLNGVIMFIKPELAKKTGQLIRKFAEMIEGRLVVERNRERRQDVADFLYLYSKQWSSKIGSIAHQTSVERRFNKKQLLPLTEDIVKIQSFLDENIEKAGKVLSNEPGKQNWREFANYLLTKVTLFNFRRGNECAAMQVEKFLNRADWKAGNSEIYSSLNRFESELAKQMDLVEVMGKQNRKVPVLLTNKLRKGINLLITTRNKCGIDGNNKYVFAKGNNSFIEGCEALRYVMARVELERPEAMRFPALRKYLATVVQVFGMNEIDLQEVARHMGHELAVHRKFYRLQDDVIELAKISKLLLAVENGKAAQYSGMSLDDLDLNDLPDEDEVGEEEEVARPLSDENSADIPFEEEAHEDGVVAKTGTVDSLAGGKVVQAESRSQEDMVSPQKEARSPIEDGPSTQKSCPSPEPCPLRLHRRVGKYKPLQGSQQSLFQFEDSDEDAEFVPGAESDSTDMDGDMSPKKKRKVSSKKKWTPEEKSILEVLVRKSIVSGKPPKKVDVDKIKSEKLLLKNIPWVKIKHQVWAMAQQKRRIAKRVLKC